MTTDLMHGKLILYILHVYWYLVFPTQLWTVMMVVLNQEVLFAVLVPSAILPIPHPEERLFKVSSSCQQIIWNVRFSTTEVHGITHAKHIKKTEYFQCLIAFTNDKHSLVRMIKYFTISHINSLMRSQSHFILINHLSYVFLTPPYLVRTVLYHMLDGRSNFVAHICMNFDTILPHELVLLLHYRHLVAYILSFLYQHYFWR